MQRKSSYYEAIKGKRQGKLQIFDVIKTIPRTGKIWRCLCDCGKETFLTTSQIVSGNVQECPDCARERRREESRKQLYKHGMHDSRLYAVWWAMQSRCGCEGDTNYRHYGGRGINVCAEWKEFEPFAKWAMANGYADCLTIERRDVNGHYEPSNCWWIPFQGQSFTRRNAHHVTVNGVTMCLTHWAKALGVSHAAIIAAVKQGKSAERYIQERLSRLDWSRLPDGILLEIKGLGQVIWDSSQINTACRKIS